MDARRDSQNGDAGTPSVGRMLNCEPSTLFLSDNLPILEGLNSEIVDLAYCDPPFNTRKRHKGRPGSSAEGQEFNDSWTWGDESRKWLAEKEADDPPLAAVINAVRLTKNDGAAAYLTFIATRLIELRRLLKPRGSVYVHCDDSANYQIRAVMDAVFGATNFRNEIAWCYRRMGNSRQRRFSRSHNTLLLYGKTADAKFNAHAVRLPYAASSLDREGRGRSDRIGGVCELNPNGRFPDDWWAIPFVRPNARERTGWATQKPIELLRRIIRASSDVGDLVLDPFAGSCTCLVAAEQEGRRWIGVEECDISRDILQARLGGEVGGWPTIKRHVSREPPTRTDAG